MTNSTIACGTEALSGDAANQFLEFAPCEASRSAESASFHDTTLSNWCEGAIALILAPNPP